ncbi:hypothetical protein Cpap_0461 [Ruminiclostridium papyrosolvens DSM 2782]|uniref:Uncharacterized protein n=1 Tax=Ruminiclostridium papyrosolvens DSM 2782 TaxID=588581 RepID=F1THG4_9FIRM|nr:hypothetical protein [Ruminiclostridium papyrosolvens]EGD46167.1 hypothetical protein Cpap_0461 [Ruminiclostridium papyrosolvens DSM 2782]WES35947.1 hypothetical protein P0092_08285 [Ruminiclostridium papyrosolvens DSM 2782]
MDNQKAESILQQIIYAAQETNNALDFGKETADILADNMLIDPAIYDILAGKI